MKKFSCPHPLTPPTDPYYASVMETNPVAFFIVITVMNVIIALVVATVGTLAFDASFAATFGISLLAGYGWDVIAALLRSPSR